MNIVLCVGVRPHFIKALHLATTINLYKGVSLSVLNSNQHYDDQLCTSDKYYLKKVSDNYLELQKPSYHELRFGLRQLQPSVVVIIGDTKTSYLSALAAKKESLPLVHVEGGARPRYVEIIEDRFRKRIDHISDVNYCSTVNSKNNLLNEGKRSGSTVFSGDLLNDIILKRKLDSVNYGYSVCTVHRKETKNHFTLERILNFMSESCGGHDVIFPAHPDIKKVLGEIQTIPDNIKIIPAMNHREFLELLVGSENVFTDSGGVLREAFCVGKSVVILRKDTEWPELLSSKRVSLWYPEHKEGYKYNENSDCSINTFGNGNAANIIANDLISRYTAANNRIVDIWGQSKND